MKRRFENMVDPNEEPRTVNIGCKLKNSLDIRLKKICHMTDRKQTSVIESALLDYCEKMKV